MTHPTGEDRTKQLTDKRWENVFRHVRIGELLLQRKIVTIPQLEEILNEQKETGLMLGELLIAKNIISRQQLLEILKWQHQADQFIMEMLIDLENNYTDS